MPVYGSFLSLFIVGFRLYSVGFPYVRVMVMCSYSVPGLGAFGVGCRSV